MKALVQRVLQASVSVDGEITGSINKGLLVFVGFGLQDKPKELDWMVEKVSGLRIFPDADKFMNLSVLDVSGEILVVSQFTLHADTRKGKRPSFTKASDPDTANILYRLFIQKLKDRDIHIAEGIFGGDMKVSLVNDGPVTIMIDSPVERANQPL